MKLHELSFFQHDVFLFTIRDLLWRQEMEVEAGNDVIGQVKERNILDTELDVCSTELEGMKMYRLEKTVSSKPNHFFIHDELNGKKLGDFSKPLKIFGRREWVIEPVVGETITIRDVQHTIFARRVKDISADISAPERPIGFIHSEYSLLRMTTKLRFNADVRPETKALIFPAMVLIGFSFYE